MGRAVSARIIRRILCRKLLLEKSRHGKKSLAWPIFERGVPVVRLHIYLSGSIKKGKTDERKKSYWTQSDIKILKDILAAKYELTMMNPAVRSDDLSDAKSTFGRDLLQVHISDIVLVDARDKKGVGIGSEMTYAKTIGIPVLTIVPPESQYNRSDFEYLGQRIDNWIHPFIYGLSDYLFDSIEDAANFILNSDFPLKNIKNHAYFMEAINHYIGTQLERDSGMKGILDEDAQLKHKIEQIIRDNSSLQ